MSGSAEAARRGTSIEGNLIGTNAAGSAALANHLSGVLINSGASGNTIGGTTAAALNVISGNMGDGVNISDSGTTLNVVEGNFIGTDVTGTLDLGNNNGVSILSSSSNNTIGGTTTGARNIISGNNQYGISFYRAGTGNVVAGNYIGTDKDGTAALGNGSWGIEISRPRTTRSAGHKPAPAT